MNRFIMVWLQRGAKLTGDKPTLARRLRYHVEMEQRPRRFTAQGYETNDFLVEDGDEEDEEDDEEDDDEEEDEGEYSSGSRARNRSRASTVSSIDLSGPTQQVFTIQGHPLAPVNGDYYQAGLYDGQPYFASAGQTQGTRLYVHYCATRQCWRITLSFDPEADTANSWMHSSRPMLPIGNTTWQVR